jgi:hypothetical protein
MASTATVTVRDREILDAKIPPGDIHLAEQPAAENIAVLVGVRGHRLGADRQIAARLGLRVGRRVNGWRVRHRMIHRST